MTTVRIRVDHDYCQGHGRCYRLAAQELEPIDANGTANPISPVIANADRTVLARVVAARDACPEQAIDVEIIED